MAIKSRLTNEPRSKSRSWSRSRKSVWEVELHFSAIFYAHLESHTGLSALSSARNPTTPSAAVSKAMQAKIKNRSSERSIKNKRLKVLPSTESEKTERQRLRERVGKPLEGQNWVKQTQIKSTPLGPRTTVRIMNINKCAPELISPPRAFN